MANASSAVASTIAVTGATGVLGGMVARLIAEAGLPQRLLVRTPDNAPQLKNSTVHRFSYTDQDASREALDGVTTLFMVSAPEGPKRLDQHRTFIESAAAAGVRHVVYTSFIGAARDSTFTLGRDHAVAEEQIKASGMDFTFLRDSFYSDFMEALVGADGVIRGPAGEGRVAVVARADVARAAAAVLQDPAAHRNATYDMTGPVALTMAEVAQILSAGLGRDITFHNETIDEAYASRRHPDLADWQLDAWVSTYTAFAAGDLAAVSDDVRTITGRRPTSLEDLLAG